MEPHKQVFSKWNIIFLIYAEISDAATPGPPTDPADAPVNLAALDDMLLQLDIYPNVNVFIVRNVVDIMENTVVKDLTYISQLVIDPHTGKKQLKKLQSLRVEDFAQKYQSIKQVFATLSGLDEAAKNILVTWDHGSAFGIFKRLLPEKPFDSRYVILGEPELRDDRAFYHVRNKPLKREPAFYSEFESADTPTANMEILSNDHLAEAITRGFAKGIVDTLIMFNCDMQNIHTCYSLRHCVQALVAPSGAIAWPGYDFKAIVELIGRNPGLSIDGTVVAAQAVNTLKNYYQGFGLQKELDTYAIFAVSLTDYEKKIIVFLQSMINELTALIKNDFLRGMLTDYRSETYIVGGDFGYYLVDLWNFLLDVSRAPQLDLISNLLDYLQAAYTSITIAKQVGNNIYLRNGTSWEDKNNIPPKGTGIYFPEGEIDTSSQTDLFFLPNGSNPSSLFKAIDWIGLINALYA